MIISCIHEGNKKFFKIKYNGKKQEVNACTECVDILKSYPFCEVLS